MMMEVVPLRYGDILVLGSSQYFTSILLGWFNNKGFNEKKIRKLMFFAICGVTEKEALKPVCHEDF